VRNLQSEKIERCRGIRCGHHPECALLLIRRAILKRAGTLHESSCSGWWYWSGGCQISLDCETIEGLETFSYHTKVRVGHKRKSALRSGKAVNSGGML